MEQEKEKLRPPVYKWLLPGVWLIFILGSATFCSGDLGDLSGDSARYLLLGRALAGGHGYVEIDRPGAPAHTEYGPGLSIILSPILKISPRSILPGKVIMYLSLAVCLFLFFRLAQAAGATGWAGASMITLVLATMPHNYRFANQVLSDLPYTAMSLAALYYLYRALNDRETAPGPWITAGLLMSAAFFFRQVGLALFGGAVIGIILHKAFLGKDRAKAVFFLSASFMIPVGTWLLRNYLVTGALDPSHAEKLFMAREADPFAGTIGFSGLITRTLKGFVDYFRLSSGVLLDLSWPFVSGPVRLILSAVALAPALYGFFLRLVNRRGPLEWYFLVYMIIICAWQSHYPRYLIPVLPLAIMFAGSGLKNILQTEPAKRGARLLKSERLIWAGLALAICINLTVWSVDVVMIRRAPVTPVIRASARPFTAHDDMTLLTLSGSIEWGRWHQYGDWVNRASPEESALRWHRLIAASAWMRENLPESSLVMARKPRLTAYYSERIVIQYIPEPQPDAFTRGIQRLGVTHLLVDEVSPLVRQLLDAYMREKPGVLTPVFTLGRTHVMAVNAVEPQMNTDEHR